jgi:hypothetical protein
MPNLFSKCSKKPGEYCRLHNPKGVKSKEEFYKDMAGSILSAENSGNASRAPHHIDTVTCYTMNGLASHLGLEDGNWVTLCGRDFIKPGHAVTIADIAEQIHQQHSNFFFCGDCVYAFTGIPAVKVRSYRDSK